jgi:hypothetical protein
VGVNPQFVYLVHSHGVIARYMAGYPRYGRAAERLSILKAGAPGYEVRV